MWRLVGRGSRRGRSAPSRAGDRLRSPKVWGAFALALSLTGPRGRRAVLRGASCSAVSSLIHLPIKRAVGRRRPRGARLMHLGGPVTTSFPSGHTAIDLSFLFGASQELPVLAVPLTAATLGSHWSLIRSRKHYPSDIVGGGAIALTVTAADGCCVRLSASLRTPRKRTREPVHGVAAAQRRPQRGRPAPSAGAQRLILAIVMPKNMPTIRLTLPAVMTAHVPA